MWQKSKCKKQGWLHDFLTVKEYSQGVLERCDKCKMTKFFSHTVPNHVYLSYHLRSALQPSLARFNKEYGNNNHN